MRKTVRLADIAKRLNVSTVTVSNALANQKGVSEEMREKIKAMAAEMGYQPVGSAAARASVNMGVIILEKYLGDHMTFYWKLYQELAVACADQGSFLLFEVVKHEAEQQLELPLLVRERRIEGLVIIGEPSRAYLRKIVDHAGIPVLFMDFYAGGFDVDCVISDNFYGMHTMTRYLVKRGHRRIAFVGTVFSNSSITDRYFGYLKAVRQYGLEERADWVIKDRELDNFWMIDPKLPEEMPSAFVCNCDLAASRLIRQLKLKGYRVPEDVSVVGYDNFLLEGLCEIGITSYGVDMMEMAAVTAKRMQERIRGNVAGPGRLFIAGGHVVEKDSVKRLNND